MHYVRQVLRDRSSHKTDSSLKRLRGNLLKDRGNLTDSQHAHLNVLLTHLTPKRTAFSDDAMDEDG